MKMQKLDLKNMIMYQVGALKAFLDELNMPLSSVTARCRELQLMNLVFDSGNRRKTSFGGTAIIWQAKRK